MNVLLLSRNGWKTTDEVHSRMNQPLTRLRCQNGVWSPSAPAEPIDILIRWASRVNLPARVVYNRARAIGTASNKAGARMILQDSGVNTPRTSTVRLGRFVGPGPMPWVLRPPTHQGGEDFYLVDSVNELREVPYGDGWYVSEFYPKQSEYRVHVAHGKVLLVNEKVPREGEEYRREEPIWNHATNNFYFRVLRWSQWPISVVREAIKATETLGLDYAAVDVMAEAPDHRYDCVICEINTSPTLEGYAAKRYARYFDWLLSREQRRPHFEVDTNNWQDYAF